MRDPNRIYDIINRLEAIWARFPDLRLGQIILNVVNDPLLYYLEDDELIKRLEEHYDNLENPDNGN